MSPETKKTMRWAREASTLYCEVSLACMLNGLSVLDYQTSNRITWLSPLECVMTLLLSLFNLSFSSHFGAFAIFRCGALPYQNFSISTRNEPLKEASYTTRTGRHRLRRFLSLILFSNLPASTRSPEFSLGCCSLLPSVLFSDDQNLVSYTLPGRRCLVPPATSTVDVDIIYLYHCQSNRVALLFSLPFWIIWQSCMWAGSEKRRDVSIPRQQGLP